MIEVKYVVWVATIVSGPPITVVEARIGLGISVAVYLVTYEI